MNPGDDISELEQSLSLQQRFFGDNRYPNFDARKKSLENLLGMLDDNREALCTEIAKDFGSRDKHQSYLVDIFPSRETLKHAIAELKRWMKVKSPEVSILFKFGSAKIVPQPLGCVGIIVPWNYPLFLAVGPLTAALAAGNTAMVKMSEYTPNFSQLFASLIAKTFPPEQVTVVIGDADVGEAFTKLPFDHLLFTGSTRVGKLVMRSASENLTPVTLELGGKSPTIIDKNFSLRRASERILNAKLINAGQTCIAPDYLFVHESQLEEFVALAKNTVKQFLPDQDLSSYTSIINDTQYERLEGLANDAENKGARRVQLIDTESQKTSRKMVPQLVLDLTSDMDIMQEEIFGPLLPVVTYSGIDEVIEKINSGPRPLALYLFSDSDDVHDKFMHQTISGGVTINDAMLHVAQENLPFGGVGHSGMGAYHGETGFKTFSHEKSIFIQSRLSAVKFLTPPYRGWRKKLIEFVARN